VPDEIKIGKNMTKVFINVIVSLIKPGILIYIDNIILYDVIQ